MEGVKGMNASEKAGEIQLGRGQGDNLGKVKVTEIILKRRKRPTPSLKVWTIIA